jgi:hypothetical protein
MSPNQQRSYLWAMIPREILTLQLESVRKSYSQASHFYTLRQVISLNDPFHIVHLLGKSPITMRLFILYFLHLGYVTHKNETRLRGHPWKGDHLGQVIYENEIKLDKSPMWMRLYWEATHENETNLGKSPMKMRPNLGRSHIRMRPFWIGHPYE